MVQRAGDDAAAGPALSAVEAGDGQGVLGPGAEGLDAAWEEGWREAGRGTTRLEFVKKRMEKYVHTDKHTHVDLDKRKKKDHQPHYISLF